MGSFNNKKKYKKVFTSPDLLQMEHSANEFIESSEGLRQCVKKMKRKSNSHTRRPSFKKNRGHPSLIQPVLESQKQNGPDNDYFGMPTIIEEPA